MGDREAQAAQDDFSRARAALDSGRIDEAVQGFTAFLKDHPHSEQADEAMYRRGQALARADRLEEAQAALQSFLEERPTSRFKDAAALELKLVQARLAKNQEAAEALQKSVDALKHDLGKVRTGRAHTGLLDHVMEEDGAFFLRVGPRRIALRT